MPRLVKPPGLLKINWRKALPDLRVCFSNNTEYSHNLCGARPEDTTGLEAASLVPTARGLALNVLELTNAGAPGSCGSSTGPYSTFSMEAIVFTPTSTFSTIAVNTVFANNGGAPNNSCCKLESAGSTFYVDHNGAEFNGGSYAPGGISHLICTFDGTTNRLYVDGVLAGNQAGTLYDTGAAGYGYTFSQANNGSFGTAQHPNLLSCFYGRALTADEVMRRYLNPFDFLVPAFVSVPAIKTASAAAYTLPAATGTFALTGVATTNLVYKRKMSVPVVSFALTGIAANLTRLHFYTLPASTGVFALTGNAAVLAYKRTAPVTAGAFALSGIAATLTYTPAAVPAAMRQYVLATPDGGVLVHETGTLEYAVYGAQVSETSTPIVSGAPYTLPAATGAFTFTGIAVNFPVRRVYTLPVTTGAFAFTGKTTGLIHNDGISAVTGAFVFSGKAAGLAAGRKLAVTTGNFTFTGIAAGLYYGPFVNHYTLIAVPAAFTFTGIAANFVRTTAYRLPVTVGAFAFSGKPAGLAVGRKVSAGTGAFVFTGKPANLVLVSARKLAADTGSFVFTGYGAGLVSHTNKVLLAGTTTFVFSGRPAGLGLGRKCAAGTGSFVLTGIPINLHHGNHRMPCATTEFRFTGIGTTYTDNDFHLPQIGQPGRIEFGRRVFAIPGRW